MTKKHFDALAAVLKTRRPDAHTESGCSRCQWEIDVEGTADVCAQFNPNFDRSRFLKACGVEESK